MEKIKEKLGSLRAEIDEAHTRSAEYKTLVKQLENEHIQKDHEISSLKSKIALYEKRLEEKEKNFQAATVNSQESDLKVEELEKNVTKLEEDLENAEKRHLELKELYKGAKDEMEELERQLAAF